MKRLLVLGSTGSVGESALRLIAEQRDRFEVVGLAAGRNAARLFQQAAELDVPAVALEHPPDGGLPPLPKGRRLVRGAGAAATLVRECEFDLALHCITGAAGLAPSVAILEKGRSLALANKESLVIGGECLRAVAARTGAAIIPVDSEHSAIFQCVRRESAASLRRIYLTASGGPFRDRPLDTFESVTREEALRHPNWSMGERITVGSATMMNKAFEIVEAHHLFGLAAEQIRVVLHRQSIVHSMVEFDDGSMMAQLGIPDMRIPIQVALHHPDRGHFDFEPFDPLRFASLTFSEPDPERYPALALGHRCVARGGNAGAVLNAADEIATRRFLDGEIRFPDIARICAAALEAIPPGPANRLEEVLAADARARTFASSPILC